MRERIHKSFQAFAVSRGQLGFQRVSETRRQTGFPTGTTIMQIRAASRQFSGRVNQHPIRCADHAHQLAFCHHGAASHTSALGNMLYALDRFLRHLQLNFPIPCPFQHKGTRERRMLYSSASSSSPRLWILRPTTSPRSSSSTNSTAFSFSSCLSFSLHHLLPPPR